MDQQLKSNDRLLSDENQEISFRFGFLGIGMGGNSIASACADISTNVSNNRFPYSAILINSNKVDLDKVAVRNPSTLKLLIGDGKGAGRDINIGEELYKASSTKIVDAVKTQFLNVDFVWLVVGLGGGTGTGSVIQAIGTLMKNGFNKKFGLILTLPRNNEGRTVVNNALQRLKAIYGAMNNLGPILLVDNQKLFEEYSEREPNASVSEYLNFSNNYVAEALHDLNTVTASYLPMGENHFDSSEFKKMLNTPGLIHFARFSEKTSNIDAGQVLSYSLKLKEEIKNGVLSSGYDLTQADRSALSVLANKNGAKRLYTLEFTKHLEELVVSIAPSASEKPVAFYAYENKRKFDNNTNNDTYFYAVFAGLDLPSERINKLMELDRQAAELEKQKEEAKQNKGNLFAGFQAATNSSTNEASFEDLFGEKEEEKTENDEVEDILKELGI